MLRLHQLGRHSALAVDVVPVEGEVGRAGRHGDTVVLRHNRRVVRSRPHAHLAQVTVERDPRIACSALSEGESTYHPGWTRRTADARRVRVCWCTTRRHRGKVWYYEPPENMSHLSNSEMVQQALPSSLYL